MSESEWLDIFGDDLKARLEEYGMTQKELAYEACLAESTISSYINKQKFPSLKAIINIAYVFDLDINDLIYADEIIY